MVAFKVSVVLAFVVTMLSTLSPEPYKLMLDDLASKAIYMPAAMASFFFVGIVGLLRAYRIEPLKWLIGARVFVREMYFQVSGALVGWVLGSLVVVVSERGVDSATYGLLVACLLIGIVVWPAYCFERLDELESNLANYRGVLVLGLWIEFQGALQ